MTASLSVNLGSRSYDIAIGPGLLANTGWLIAPRLPRKRVILVTDANVAALYLAGVEASLTKAGITHHAVILPPGEQTKSFAALERLMGDLLALTPDRKTTLIALGGGVVGDITGFAASILLRGVDYIQIPTSLLAQVDSSVGGKTGINTPQGKNLVGSFHQPRLVLADMDTLVTLPQRELLAGYAEVVKYGVINDSPFFEWLEAHGTKALAGDKVALAHMVRKSCEAKALIVGQDEREAGLRAILNFGHTLGHALEAETGFSDTLLHGEAVAIGMVLALKLSVLRGLCAKEHCARVERHLKAVGLKTAPREVMGAWDKERLIEHCYHDKKATAGGLTFILAEKIGKVDIFHDIKRSELEALLAEALAIV
jgi:3-dehydroquinate synthase